MLRGLLLVGLFLAIAATAGAERRSDSLISFWSDRSDGRPGVWVMRPDGSGQRLLTGALHAKRGSFSPDGSRLVFDGPVAVRNGVVMFDFDVYVMNADGSSKRRIVRGPTRDVLAVWSPDGKTIAFTRSARERGPESIWLVGPDGKNLRRLHAGAGPVWSPDGASLAFGALSGGKAAVYVMNANGKRPRRLTGAGIDAAPTDWSRAGKILLARYETGRGADIWVMDGDGSHLERLTRNAADDFDGTWSPDGAKILFTSDRAGGKDVWVMNADGLHPVRLTTASSDDWATDWQP